MTRRETGLDPFARLRILSVALPGSRLAIRETSAPFDAVWKVIQDLETFSPRYERAIVSAKLEVREGELELRAAYVGGQIEDFTVRLDEGWCLLQSPSFVAAFAAKPTERGCLVGHLERWRSRGQPTINARKLSAELVEIERLAHAIQDR